METSHSHHAPKLLPQSPQDSPVRGVKPADRGALLPGVTGAGAGGEGIESPAAAAAMQWEMEHVKGAGHMASSLAHPTLMKLIFGLGASFGFNALVVANGTLMDYYQEKYGLSTSFLSLADFLVGSLTLYAVVGFGYWSDMSTSSWGRRKPFVVALTPVLAFSLVMLFSPRWAPPGKSSVAAWFGVFYAMQQVSISAMTVVIAAWGTSLTHAVGERASLYTIDAVMDLLGFLAGVFITAVGVPHTTGIALAFVFVAQNILLVRCLRDEPATSGVAASGGSHGGGAVAAQVPFIAGLHLSFQNKQFMTLFKAAVFGSIVGTTVNLLPIFFQVVMGVGDEDVERVYSIYVQAVVASAFVAVMSTSTLNARWGKIRTLKFGVGCGAVYGLVAFCTSYAKSVTWFYLTSVPAGAFAGIVTVNGNVLLSNSIDYDQLKTGFRRQSLYQCLIYVPMTFVSVAGSSIPLSIITAFGGLEAGRTPPAAVVQTLRLWISLIVTGCLFISYHQLASFKLTEAVQEDVSAQLKRREDGEFLAPRDPLEAPQDPVDGGIELSESAGPAPSSSSSSSSSTAAATTAAVDEVRVGIDVDGPSEQPWHATTSFLELNFSSRELALLTLPKGKEWKLGTYLLNLVASVVYAVVMLMETIAAVEQRNDLTSAEIFACFFMLASSMAIYEAARLHALKEIYYLGDEQDVARWARRRLTARKNVHPAALHNPFKLVRRTIIAHVCLGIALIMLITSLSSPL